MGLQKKTNVLPRTEDVLKKSEERYCGMIAELADYAIILLSKEGVIESWNKGAEMIKGYTRQEAQGNNFRIFYTPEDQARSLPEALIQEATNNGKANHEGWGVRKAGTRFWAGISITALHDNQNRVIGFSEVTRDLTEQRANELKIEEFNHDLKVKNELLRQSEERYHRMVSEVEDYVIILLGVDGTIQNWNKGAQKIKGYSEEEIVGKHFSIFYSAKDRKKKVPDRFLVEAFRRGKDETLSEKGKDYLKRMQAGALRMQHLIHDILTYSLTTTSEKKLEQTDLNDLLMHATAELEVLIMEKKAVIETDTLPSLNVIRYQMQQLFNNLLNNALKFSKAGTPPLIVVRANMVDGKELQKSYPVPAKQYCHISFKDNGIGFESIYNKRIFEVFQRLHSRSEYAGAGIGLAICKKIAENHDGLLTAESRPNEGAIFHIYLPVLE